MDAQLAEMALWLAERRPESEPWEQKMCASLKPSDFTAGIFLFFRIFHGFSIYGSKIPWCGRSGL